MSRDELAELVSDLHALLNHQQHAGHLAEEIGAEAPEADPEVVAALEAAEPEPEDDEAGREAWASVVEAPKEEEAPAWRRLQTVRDDLGDCTRCKLCEKRKNIVFGVGNPDADLLIIGEGPGEREDQRGEPFVGPSGQMLDRMLAGVLGLQRDEVYIANVVKCRPPQNRDPEEEEVAACKPFLQRQIDAIRPKLILVLGRIAMEETLGLRGITRSRGKEVLYEERIPAIPTFHPSYLLRKPELKRDTFNDLKLLRARYDELGGRRS